MPNKKYIRYYRHSLKDAENNISPEGLELARRSVAPLAEGPFEIGFDGPLVRTTQTLVAMMGTSEAFVNCFVVHKTPIAEIGDNALFVKMHNDQFEANSKSGMSNIDALVASHSAEMIESWQESAAFAVFEAFDIMSERQVSRGIMVGNDPVVSLAARQLGWKDAPSLEYCEYIDFVMMEDNEEVLAIKPE